METLDPEVILPGELRTVATRLCDPLAVTLPLHHSTPLEPPSSHETPTRFGTQQISPVSHQSQTPSEGSITKHRVPEVFTRLAYLFKNHLLQNYIFSDTFHSVEFPEHAHLFVMLQSTF